MADKSISDLRELSLSGVRSNDPLAIVNVGASETMKVQVKDLIQAGIQFIDNGSIPGEKLNAAVPPDSITSLELADHAVTAIKLADGSACNVAAGAPIGAGSYQGQLYLDTITSKVYCWDSNNWVEIKAAGSINDVSGFVPAFSYPSIATLTTQTGDSVRVSAVLPDTTGSRQFLAGPSNAAGQVVARAITGADLPVATSTEKGGVIVNGNGLTMNGDRVEIDNTVAPSLARSLVTFNQQGLIQSGSPLAASDLPPATASEIGGVKPGTGLQVDVDGTLNHPITVTPGDYAKVSVSETGHVVGSVALQATDIPALDASKITSGTLSPAVIGDKSITKEKLADYAISYIQEAQPPVINVPIGELWFQESTAQLSMWNGNSWFPVGQARLTAENLRYCGTVDADTNLIAGVTKFGTGAGYAIGDAPKAATDSQIGVYFVVSNPGSNITLVPGEAFDNGDWLLCNGAVAGTGWERIDTLSSGGGGGGATNLGDLLDVTLTTPQAGEFLAFTAGGQWVNVLAPAAPGTVAPGTPTNGQIWVDTSVNPPKVNVYDQTNTAWVEVLTTTIDGGTY